MIELDRGQIDELLREQFVARIGCQADGEVYVVPIIYAYDGDAFYVASVEGRKVELMRAEPRVCFEVDRYEELLGEDAERALDLLAARFDRPRTRKAGPGTVCFRIVLESVTGRAVAR